MPFPDTLDPAHFQAGPIRDAYRFAKESPQVLVQQPCYCAGPRSHSLLDCFASMEATICATCVDEVLLISKLRGQGMTASEIRATLIRRYAPSFVGGPKPETGVIGN